MRKPLIAANWKMNGDVQFTYRYAAALAKRRLPESVDIVLFPPAPYLPLLREQLGDAVVALGGQNLHPQPSGAFTGEIAAEMLNDLGARWVLVGHSERRQEFGETDALVAEKFVAARRAGLRPVLCVGETLAERDAGSAEAVVIRQLRVVLDRVGPEGFADAALAYEPVWAIGTGRTAQPAEADAMHRELRGFVAGRDAGLADRLRILYGGSVKAGNAATLLAQPDIDGALVGGASLDVDEFLGIVTAAAADGAGTPGRATN